MNRADQNDLKFEYQETINQEDELVLFEGLNDDAMLKKKMDRIRTFGIFIKDTHGIVLGGVTGFTYYGCLYVDLLWVKEELQHQGLGTTLMQKAEKIACERHCSFATLNTMDWEALPFYQKLGYEIEFIREGYEKNSKKYMLRKKL